MKKYPYLLPAFSCNLELSPHRCPFQSCGQYYSHDSKPDFTFKPAPPAPAHRAGDALCAYSRSSGMDSYDFHVGRKKNGNRTTLGATGYHSRFCDFVYAGFDDGFSVWECAGEIWIG